MGIITKIEEKIEGIVEKPFRISNGFDLPSIEIAVKRLLEKKKKDILGRMLVPNSISILIDEHFYKEQEPFLADMVEALLKALCAWNKEHGYEFHGDMELAFKKGSIDGSSYHVFAYFKEVRGGNRTDAIKKDATEIGQLRNSKTGEIYDIYADGCIIGRGDECTDRINDPAVSRKHAEIVYMNGRVVIRDLGSRAGTRVNLVRTGESRLADGDKISIGSTELIFSRPVAT